MTRTFLIAAALCASMAAPAIAATPQSDKLVTSTAVIGDAGGGGTMSAANLSYNILDRAGTRISKAAYYLDTGQVNETRAILGASNNKLDRDTLALDRSDAGLLKMTAPSAVNYRSRGSQMFGIVFDRSAKDTAYAPRESSYRSSSGVAAPTAGSAIQMSVSPTAT
ncbi:MAG: hypothetical protein V4480_03960 [Patescibacteria group bacterium]